MSIRAEVQKLVDGITLLKIRENPFYCVAKDCTHWERELGGICTVGIGPNDRYMHKRRANTLCPSHCDAFKRR